MDPAELGAGDGPAHRTTRWPRGQRPAHSRFARKYGSKAANLGFLAHRSVLGRASVDRTVSRRFGYDLVPEGFGIPLSFYRNLVEHPDERRPANRTRRVHRRGEGRERCHRRTGPSESSSCRPASSPRRSRRPTSPRSRPSWPQALPGVKKIKIRSSANAEDVPNFDGAGLHDSFAATVSKQDNPDGSCAFEIETDSDAGDSGGQVKRKVSPRSVACAIKGVYASLWNQRAVEERTFARIDHATVAMGLSVVPTYDAESDGGRECRGRDQGDQRSGRLRIHAVGPGRQQPRHQSRSGHRHRGDDRRPRTGQRADVLHGHPVRHPGGRCADQDRTGAGPAVDARPGGYRAIGRNSPIARRNPATTTGRARWWWWTTRSPPRWTWSSSSWTTVDSSASRSESSAGSSGTRRALRRGTAQLNQVSPRTWSKIRFVSVEATSANADSWSTTKSRIASESAVATSSRKSSAPARK